MQQIFLNSIVKGYARPMLYYKSYITQLNYINNKKIVCFRLKVICHAEKYGMNAALDAFDVKRATFFLWKRTLKNGAGKIESLAPQSTAPHTKRRRQEHPWHIEQIILLRNARPLYNLGKSKLKPMLDKLSIEYGQPIISETTIGRLINDLKKAHRLPKKVRLSINGATGKLHEIKRQPRIVKKRRGKYIPRAPGDLVQVDCVTKFIDGIKRYVISAIDYKSSFAYSYAYKTLTSANARDFFLKLQSVAPFTITHVQTDNGLEFHKYFMHELDYQALVHFWNYPRRPQSNGKIERYNRTSQEEFIDYNLATMAYDIDEFNQLLTDWCIYYNTERPHATHKTIKTKNTPSVQIPPMKALINMLNLEEEKSNMLWTYTNN